MMTSSFKRALFNVILDEFVCEDEKLCFGPFVGANFKRGAAQNCKKTIDMILIGLKISRDTHMLPSLKVG